MQYLSADACFFPEMQICILDKFLLRTTKRRKMKSGNSFFFSLEFLNSIFNKMNDRECFTENRTRGARDRGGTAIYGPYGYVPL